MPEPTPPPTPWYLDFTKVMLITTTIIGAINGFQTNCNGRKTDENIALTGHVAAQQDQQTLTAAVIKKDLNDAATITESKLDKIVEKTAEVKNTVQVIDSKLPKK